MSVVTFGPAEFEAVLHADWPTVRSIGVRKGEHVWVIPVVPDATIGVIVRSSIRADGVAADVGRDSIRAWLGHVPDGAPWAPKMLGRWTTRKPGWPARVHRVIGELITLAGAIRPCPACGAWMKIIGKAGSLRLRCEARAEGFLDFDGLGRPMEIPGVPCWLVEPIQAAWDG
jgi:hypothetical protein